MDTSRISQLRRTASRRNRVDEPPARWRRILTWGGSTGLAAAAAVAINFATNLGTSAQEKAADVLWGETSSSTLRTDAGPTLNLDVAQGMGCSGQGWVYPVPRSQATVPPGAGRKVNGRTWDKAPVAFGAVTADPVVLTITATGKLDHAVVLKDLKFHVESRKPALKGTVQNVAQGCGEGGTIRYGEVNLDSSPPYWIPSAKLPSYMRADALKFPYTVTANNLEILMITVRIPVSDCTWYAELTWVDGNKEGKSVIKDHGTSFRTTASRGLPSLGWAPGDKTPWVKPTTAW